VKNQQRGGTINSQRRPQEKAAATGSPPDLHRKPSPLAPDLGKESHRSAKNLLEKGIYRQKTEKERVTPEAKSHRRRKKQTKAETFTEEKGEREERETLLLLVTFYLDFF
jgi:hypothetical protein